MQSIHGTEEGFLFGGLNENQANVLIAHTPVAVIDPLGNILFPSEAFCTLTGYSDGELRAGTSRLECPTRARAFLRGFRRRLSREGCWKPTSGTREGWRPYWAKTTIAPLPSHRDDRRYFISFTDTTAFWTSSGICVTSA